MLELDNLELRQGDFSLRADWSVQTGQTLALLGPSGAGKSTLLSGIAGFLAPVQGRVIWNGQDVTGWSPAQRPVAMLFQDGNLFPHLSVAQNVGLGRNPNLRLDAADRQNVAQALHRVGLDGMETRRPGALSGGQQSRVALARVLVMQRPVLLLDEPFAALGPALRVEMLDLVKQVTQENNTTVIMVTHDPKDAARIADVASVVAENTTTPPIETKALLANPPTTLRTYLG